MYQTSSLFQPSPATNTFTLSNVHHAVVEVGLVRPAGSLSMILTALVHRIIAGIIPPSAQTAVSLISNRIMRTATAIVKRKTRAPFWQSLISHRRYRWYAALLLAFVLFACVMIVGGVSLRLITLRRTVVVTPLLPINTVREQPALILSVGIPYINAKPVVPDLCFDFLKTLVGPTIVLDSAADLTALYEKADTSDLCSSPTTRYEFDFAKYQIIGAVTVGTGCSLDLTYQSTVADDLARTQTIELQRQVIGSCGYELVRPIWLAVERNGYAMSIKIS